MRPFSYSKRNISIFAVLTLLAVGGLVLYVAQEMNKAATISKEAQDRTGECGNKNLPYRDTRLSSQDRAADLLGRMTMKEKVGQLALVDKNGIKDPNDITKYGIGGVLSGGGGNPDSNTPSGWWEMVSGFESYSQKSCLGIPIFYGVDGVHGHSNLPQATIFPQAIGLGATNDPDLVKRVSGVTAEEMAATGVYWNYFPSMDVAKDIRWGRTYETFGSDVGRVSTLGAAYIQGFQGVQISGIIPMATAKHYIGAGATEWGTSSNLSYQLDQGNAEIDESVLRAEHLPPFKAAVENGAGSVMVGLNSWNGEKIAGSHYLITDVLKEELGFQGIVITDWHGGSGLKRDECESWQAAINAGVDVIMLPEDYERYSSCMERAVTTGGVSKTRLDDAVLRILRVKFAMGLFDRTGGEPDMSVIGSRLHRDTAREAVRKSLVLLKNENDALPIRKDARRILVGGSGADNLGKQAGGWTVNWQGGQGNLITGTSILAGIMATVSENTEVEFDREGAFSPDRGKADVGIAVVGEDPYAEGWGDRDNPSLSQEDLAAVEKIKAVSNRVVVVILSGRPLDIKGVAGDWDAVVAAWLPGSEGEGVSDVLFGDYPFVGTLPLPWQL